MVSQLNKVASSGWNRDVGVKKLWINIVMHHKKQYADLSQWKSDKGELARPGETVSYAIGCQVFSDSRESH